MRPTLLSAGQGRPRRIIAAAVAAAFGFTLFAVAATQASAAASCSASYATQSQWGGGFVAGLTVTNTGTTAISGWTVTFTYPGDQKVTNFWNTTVTQSGENITATNVSYNGTIAAGANTSFGWQGTWTTSDAVPTSITCNGSGGGGGGTPTVSLTSPAAGATFTAPASIALAASASESGGSIAQVQFLTGSTVIGTVTTSPYTFTWTNVAAGSYSLTARATDASGNTATSAAVPVTVNPASTPAILATPASLSVTQGTTATFGVTLNRAPAANVTVTVARASGNTGLSVSSGGSLTFTPANWNTAQNVTIAANATGTGAAVFTASASGYTSASVTATEIVSCGSACGHVADPYTGATQYLNPNYVSEVNAQASADGNNAAEAAVGRFQTGIWMDHIGAIAGDSTHLGLQAQLDNAETQVQGSTPMVFEVVIYDLPGRDCAALASNGEIPATAAGLTQYESQYIDPITSILAMPKYANLRIVAIIEPDSLPNVVTNQSKSACSTATPFYEQGITYTLNKLHAVPNVYNYLDIAHSAWLGWPSNMSQTPNVYNTVVKGTTASYASIDGFISDTANYTPTQEPFLPNPTLNVGGNPLDSVTFYQFNPTFDELTYDTQMYNTLVSAGFPASKRFLIDTSRNGWGGPLRPTSLNSSPTTAAAYVAANKIDQRPFRGDWCNQNNAGIGARPADEPFGTSSPVMAFVWIKPPGESDGDYPTSTHTHGDPHCDPAGTNTDGNGGTYSTGSIPGFDVPAGQWFAAEFQMLVKNSFPSLP